MFGVWVILMRLPVSFWTPVTFHMVAVFWFTTRAAEFGAAEFVSQEPSQQYLSAHFCRCGFIEKLFSIRPPVTETEFARWPSKIAEEQDVQPWINEISAMTEVLQFPNSFAVCQCLHYYSHLSTNFVLTSVPTTPHDLCYAVLPVFPSLV